MNNLVLFVLVTFGVGLIWQLTIYVRKHGILDILVAVFAIAALVGAVKVYNYAKGGYHV